MMNRISRLLTLASLLFLASSLSAEDTRWRMRPDGSILWQTDRNLPHEDHIEMSGKQLSFVLRYGVDADGHLLLNKSMVWPMLRTLPDITYASLMRRFSWDPLSCLMVDRHEMEKEKVDSIALDGTMQIWSHAEGMLLHRQIFPSTDKPALVEIVRVTNPSDKRIATFECPQQYLVQKTVANQGRDGSYTIVLKTDKEIGLELNPGESFTFTSSIQAYSTQKGEKELSFDGEAELRQRQNLVAELQKNLVLETPDEVINRMFAFGKIRASESIYETAGGPMHGPGGESYYAALWCNDEAEYVSPFFPFEGYEYGSASALNCYRWYAKFMNDEYKPIPSSIIAEGRDIWNGAGDRGDAAMIAHGASRYLLTRASRQEAEELMPLVEWCLEYCHRKLNDKGVVLSDHDELEGRFPAGDANLSTSSLYYDGLLSAAYLCEELGHPASQAKTYRKRAAQLRKAMEAFFGAEMKGHHTYRYYEGNDLLRSWICMPLVVGIFDRVQGTIDALFSPTMWTDNGLLTQEGSETFWDRSTLYALRGVYASGNPDKATPFLHFLSTARLLGDHVPYAIEAWPEGSQRHLSAESALYGRVITEGLFGIRPTGFHSFQLTPQLPTDWPRMALRHIRAFGTDFDLTIERLLNGKLSLTVAEQGGKVQKKTLRNGQSIQLTLGR